LLVVVVHLQIGLVVVVVVVDEALRQAGLVVHRLATAAGLADPRPAGLMIGDGDHRHSKVEAAVMAAEIRINEVPSNSIMDGSRADASCH
jgi:hypothetical protein